MGILINSPRASRMPRSGDVLEAGRDTLFAGRPAQPTRIDVAIHEFLQGRRDRARS
jgi:hypothetical protein